MRINHRAHMHCAHNSPILARGMLHAACFDAATAPLPLPFCHVRLTYRRTLYVCRTMLTDEARKCQCMDHRIRKHDCKHIKLILTQLGVVDKPGDAWREVRRAVRGVRGSAGCSVRRAACGVRRATHCVQACCVQECRAGRFCKAATAWPLR